MSFLLDPALLIVIGLIIASLARKGVRISKKLTLILSIITIVSFWSIGVLLYFDHLEIHWLGEAGRGRHFMWNSGIESIGLKPPINVAVTYVNPLCTLNILAILLFASYPIFLYLGMHMGWKIFGKITHD